MEKLNQQEEKAMRKIWNLGPFVVRMLQNEYPDPKPPYTTVASIVKNLERKKYLRSRRVGNVYEYFAEVQPDDYKKAYIKDAVSNYFSNSYKELVSFFAKEEEISKKDLQDVIHMIEEGEKGDK
jgi:predicted transcriptional regulator